MTPTQTQIEAAIEALREYNLCKKWSDIELNEPIAHALKRASEANPIAVDKRPLLDRMKPFSEEQAEERADILTAQEQNAIKNATIERCAQVAENYVHDFDVIFPGRKAIAAAIRALKDQ